MPSVHGAVDEESYESYLRSKSQTPIEEEEEDAIKLEWQRAEKGRKLLAEAKLYKSLGDCSYIPGMRWSGIEGEYNVMVMDLLGPSLEELFRSCGRRFSVQTVLSLA